MSSVPPLEDPWLDQQLQAVPLPAGLLARLRSIAVASDEDLDAALREVPIEAVALAPGGWMARLREIPLDVALDQRLRDVAVPAGLSAALLPDELQPALQPAAALADEAWDDDASPDEAFADEAFAPEPLVVERRGLEATHHDRGNGPRFSGARFSWAQFGAWTAAACLTLVVGGIVFFATQPKFTSPDPGLLADLNPVEIDDPPNWIEPQPPLEFVATLGSPASSEPDPPLVLAGRDAGALQLGPDHDMLELASRLPLLKSKWMLNWEGKFLSYQLQKKVRDLERAADLAPRGVPLPLVLGYDSLFQHKHRVHPIVAPAANERLQSVSVPLVTRTASYDYLRQLIARGELPPSERIRVEEFMAATGVAGPQPAPGQIDLRVSAGPSPFAAMRTFGSEGQQRLPPGKPQMVAVQTAAGSIARRTHRATHLVVALDTSESMGWGNRFEHARRGLGSLVNLMEPNDLLTVVRLGTQAEVIVDRAHRADAAHLESSLAQTAPRGALDIGQGLQVAGELALQSDERLSKQLVIVTDGVEGLAAEPEARVAAMLAALGQQRVEVLLLDVSGPSAPRGTLARLAIQGKTHVKSADSSTEVRAALAEALTGGNSVLAEEAVLSVKFNPKLVAGYRLLGHENSIGGGVIPPGIESTILAGDQTTVLFEVWLADPTASDPSSSGSTGDPSKSNLLEATLTWQQPGSSSQGSSKTEQRQARLSAGQVLAQWESLPIDVQAALLAAEAADVLRGSYFAVGRNRDLGPLLAFEKSRVSSVLSSDPSYKEFMNVLRAAAKVRR